MFSLPDHHLGDAWFATTAERAHLYFLHCPQGVARHTFWSVGHASSTDLVNWEHHGAFLHSDSANPARSCLSTGSVACYGDRYVMALLANHNQLDPAVLLAESTDLHTWRELPPTRCRLSDSGYSPRPSLPFKNPRWRDPFLFEHEGWLYQLMTAADDRLPRDRDGIVAVMRTRDLVTWEFLPPLRTPPLGADLECPKLHYIDGRWHLLVSMFNVLQSPDFAALQPPGLNSSTTFALVADRLDGEFRLSGSGRILESDTPGCPYACDAVEWRGRWHLLGTCWNDRLGDRINDPIPLQVTPAGLRSSQGTPDSRSAQ